MEKTTLDTLISINEMKFEGKNHTVEEKINSLHILYKEYVNHKHKGEKKNKLTTENQQRYDTIHLQCWD